VQVVHKLVAALWLHPPSPDDGCDYAWYVLHQLLYAIRVHPNPDETRWAAAQLSRWLRTNPHVAPGPRGARAAHGVHGALRGLVAQLARDGGSSGGGSAAVAEAAALLEWLGDTYAAGAAPAAATAAIAATATATATAPLTHEVAAVLAACGKARDRDPSSGAGAGAAAAGRRGWAFARRHGLAGHAPVLNAAITMFSRCVRNWRGNRVV
jgi:hypothetical protein